MHSSPSLILITALCLSAFIDPMSVGVGGRNVRPVRSPWTDWFPQRNRVVEATQSSPSTSHRHVYAAIIFGRGHVITFDGKYYNYPMDSDSMACPHILARDHQQYRFILLQNRRSITVYTPHSVLTLHQNNKAEVNNTGSYRDLPVHSWDRRLSVTHDNQNVILRTSLGIIIDCDIEHEECVIELNSTLHNHTMGLLGTNDNDSSNDFILRSGQEATSVQEFINYYELTGVSTCRPPAPAVARPLCPVAYLSARCIHLFGRNTSPLAACFGVVSPLPYRAACQYDVDTCNLDNKGEAICNTVRAYVKMCKTRGVNVHATQNCVKCDQHKFGFSWTEQTHKKMDVIVATSLNSGLMLGSQSLGGMLRHVLQRLENQLRRQANIQNVRMGILGYGGQGPLENPHVYTFQGEPFTRHYNAAIWNQVLESLTLEGNTVPDPYLALQSTLHYPFRSDAVKVVFLLVGQEQSAISQTEVNSLKNLLSSRGVFVNVVRRASSQQTQQQSGTSNNAAGDALSQIVQATGGATYDLNEVASLNTQTISLIGNELRRQVYSQLHMCRSCSCGQGSDHEGLTTCSTCV